MANDSKEFFFTLHFKLCKILDHGINLEASPHFHIQISATLCSLETALRGSECAGYDDDDGTG